MADRFVDSLLFVAVVHTFGLRVEFLSHAMNYMLYFEGEISQDTQTGRVVLAHLLSSSALHCGIVGPSIAGEHVSELQYALVGTHLQRFAGRLNQLYCQCSYLNDNHNPDLLGFHYIRRLAQYPDCMALAGYSDEALKAMNGIIPVPQGDENTIGGSAGTTLPPGLACDVLSPAGPDESSPSVTRFIDGADYMSVCEGRLSGEVNSSYNAGKSIDLDACIDVQTVTLRCTFGDAKGELDLASIKVSGSYQAEAYETEPAISEYIAAALTRHYLVGDGSVLLLELHLVLTNFLRSLTLAGRQSIAPKTNITIIDLQVNVPWQTSGDQASWLEWKQVGGIRSTFFNSHRTPTGLVSYETNLCGGTMETF